MARNLEKYKDDLSKLIALGEKMSLDIDLRSMGENMRLSNEHKELKRKIYTTFEKEYQKWYTEAYAIIKQILPDRLCEFETLYKGEGKRKEVNVISYTIQDWLAGVRVDTNPITREKYFNDFGAASMRFKTQLGILKSVEMRFQSSLFDIRQLTKADLFDSELDSARELLKNGFIRGAGAIAGVVLEKHLSDVCVNHKIAIPKKNPTISDLNDSLKKNNVIDIPNWRFIQRLGDLRNLSDHKKQRDPTEDEVAELIDGADKIIKTLS